MPQTPPIDPTTAISVLTGIVLPWLIDLLLAKRATSRYAAWFAFGACLVVGALVTFLGHQFVGEWSPRLYDNAVLVLTNVLLLTGTAWATWSRLWKPSGVSDALRATGGELGKPGATTGIPAA